MHMITEEVNQSMTYKPYFPYYRNAFRQNLTHKADKMEDVDKDNQKAVVEEQGEKDNQSVEINEKAAVFEHNNFNQVSPGLFQFKKPHQAAVAAVHPSNSRLEPGKQTPQFKDCEKTKNSEVGFVRLDTLPGVYSKYSTPVYQFT